MGRSVVHIRAIWIFLLVALENICLTQALESFLSQACGDDSSQQGSENRFLLNLYYTYRLDYDIGTKPDLLGIETAVAHGLIQDLGLCNEEIEHPIAVTWSAMGHQVSSQSRCFQSLEEEECQIINGVTSFLIEKNSLELAGKAFGIIEKVIEDVSILNQFTSSPIKSARVLNSIGENVFELNDTKKGRSGPSTTLIVVIVLAFLLTCMGLYMYFWLSRKQASPSDAESRQQNVTKRWDQMEAVSEPPSLPSLSERQIKSVTWSVSDISAATSIEEKDPEECKSVDPDSPSDEGRSEEVDHVTKLPLDSKSQTSCESKMDSSQKHSTNANELSSTVPTQNDVEASMSTTSTPSSSSRSTSRTRKRAQDASLSKFSSTSKLVQDMYYPTFLESKSSDSEEEEEEGEVHDSVSNLSWSSISSKSETLNTGDRSFWTPSEWAVVSKDDSIEPDESSVSKGTALDCEELDTSQAFVEQSIDSELYYDMDEEFGFL